ncbi:hypothetical protein DD607_05125 [Salmonella sp. 3DZ2-4SM]|uniref:Uncharacterized protein n=1 Tax=Mammaliicoccus sciuri TaxID=1296 RepID=A0AB37HZK9_MAMSC|nr:hypothetical protein [Mammaliicoccus sciuri]QRN92763.1 hypothetical protein JRU67_14925 [Mammaliicoccus sciuri]RXY94817.1 hypothetical protein DD607_05125 [Salmonella sp. 3DZ2-4SM]
MNKYLIPKDLRSQIKFGFFTLMDISVLAGSVIVWYIIINQVNFGLTMNIILLVLHLLLGLFLVMRTRDNPDRPRLSVILSVFLHQDDVNYKSIDYNTFKKRGN